MQQAGYPNGVYTGPQVTMVADNTPPGSNTAQVVAADLAKIGFNVKTISVTHTTMYTRYCNVPKNEPNICPNVGWLPDFHDPQTILDVTFNGKNILPQQLELAAAERPEDQRRDGRGQADPRPAARYRGVGADRQAGDRTAAAVPWLWENYPTLFSTRVVPAAPELWNGGSPDVTFMAVNVVVAHVDAARHRASRPPEPLTGGRQAQRRRARRARWRGIAGSSMLRYIMRRILWGVVLLFVVSALTFLIFYTFPSADPAALRAGARRHPS